MKSREIMFKVKPFKLEGNLLVPASKSHMQRAAICAALAKGKSILFNPIYSDDVVFLLSSLEQLGAKIQKFANRIEIDGATTFSRQWGTLFAGESGFNARALAVLASVAVEATRSSWCVTGFGSLLRRDMRSLLQALAAAGVKVHQLSATFPLWVTSMPQSSHINLDASETSQVLSGMLLAFPALSTFQQIRIKTHHLVSRPYIELTIDVLKKFGVVVNWTSEGEFIVPCKQMYKPGRLAIEGDWSHASLWMAAAAVGGKLSLHGLSQHSSQGDKIFINLLEQLGVNIKWKGNDLHVESTDFFAFEADVTDHPDLAPALVLLAMAAHGTSRIDGINRLQNKESNRLLAITSFLEQLQVPYIVNDNVLQITGRKFTFPDVIEVPPDHRLVMMAVLAGSLRRTAYYVPHLEAITKSYPHFLHQLINVAR